MILKRPIFTEKARILSQKGEYVFEVGKKATKNEIRKAIEDQFGVRVEEIRILKIPPKRRKSRGFLGWKKGYKKAIVKLKEGEKLEIFE